ncbi:hypothetical protein [Desulfovibrio inopinatus]|uniref:hypothetical protein n=1 Tax=Desulfovibrio inopinatus TaxID=102109 RepID=UPI000428589C|nr:hypothetical protein [Desulfovibrio inopinatus]
MVETDEQREEGVDMKKFVHKNAIFAVENPREEVIRDLLQEPRYVEVLQFGSPDQLECVGLFDFGGEEKWFDGQGYEVVIRHLLKENRRLQAEKEQLKKDAELPQYVMGKLWDSLNADGLSEVVETIKKDRT